MSNSELIGFSTRAVFENVGLVAPVDSAVLIGAKPAPARKMIAQAIHEASSRRNDLFLSLNLRGLRFAGFAEFTEFARSTGSETAIYRGLVLFSET